jgi:hypothetical protein
MIYRLLVLLVVVFNSLQVPNPSYYLPRLVKVARAYDTLFLFGPSRENGTLRFCPIYSESTSLIPTAVHLKTNSWQTAGLTKLSIEILNVQKSGMKVLRHVAHSIDPFEPRAHSLNLSLRQHRKTGNIWNSIR